MDRLQTMQVFVQVAERASFAEAARALSLSAARVTRAVAALEERCGARLLHRTTRVVRLTDAGSRYLSQCKQILGAVDEAEAQVASSQRELSGQLSLTAPVLFGRYHVAPVLFAFLREHPKLNARITFADSVIDLLEQQVDVAVRIGNLPDSGLSAIRVGQVRRVTVGAPSYLRAHGTPTHPDALREHTLIAFAGMAEPQRWTYKIDGKLDAVSPTPRVIVNSGEVAIEAVRAGHGLTKVLSYQVVDDVRAKRLKILLAAFETPPVPVHVVHVDGRAASRRVRAFVEFAVERLRASLAHAELP
ncbi:MAG TPA: LysR substrate-binding domain-containing protein [Polyangiales bacterium]|nr:LysR substrate-binding domain-containing protein [Polyangiales bacterium]